MARNADDEFLIAKPRRPSLARVLCYTPYCKCLCSTFLLLGCIAYALLCHFKHSAYSGLQPLWIHQHGACAQGYNLVPILLAVMLYTIYIMECWNCRRKLANMKKISIDDAVKYLNLLRESIPVVWWKSVNYHYARRTRQITRYRNGDTLPATQVFYERVDTQAAGSVFIYENCGIKDITRQIAQLNKHRVTRIRLSKGFVFACLQAANEFEEQRTRFFNENEAKDDYMQVREGMELDGCDFVDELLCFDSLPFYLHPVIFWFFSIFLLSWPLRITAECCTSLLNLQINKLFGTNYLSPSSMHYTGPLTRTSSIRSDQLEAALMDQQYFIVPSYSQAILLAAQQPTCLFSSNYAPLTNDPYILTNYGAIANNNNDECMSLPVFPRRPLSVSRSMSYSKLQPENPLLPPRRPSIRTPRSFSLAGLSRWSSAANEYQRLSSPDPSDEAPPPYEV
ncbi:hypothetical protein WR25_04355 [Diploscapter pachys]|uniref:Transmembrane protein 151B n=1 Tax=Diploscapter pachys TaxID=2018661 RepID=A0A2A2LYY7_9BILA|nr:hypothetical protein WR25_04355 [Diploscapter pachys]